MGDDELRKQINATGAMNKIRIGRRGRQSMMVRRDFGIERGSRGVFKQKLE